MPEGERASMDGTVPGSVTYEPWLREQPAKVQDFMLGPTRGRLFRSDSHMSLTQFFDDVGRPFALADLAARDAKLFLSLSDAEILDLAQWIGEARAKTLAARTARKPKS